MIKVTIVACSPTTPRAHIDPFQTRILALAVPHASTSSLATTAEHIYVKRYDHDSQRMAEAWKVGFGYGIRKNWWFQLKHLCFIAMHLITIWSMKWLYPVWPYGVSNQINWPQVFKSVLQRYALVKYDWIIQTLYYTTLHLEALQGSLCVCTQIIRACVVL